jgi:hypothetical protein
VLFIRNRVCSFAASEGFICHSLSSVLPVQTGASSSDQDQSGRQHRDNQWSGRQEGPEEGRQDSLEVTTFELAQPLFIHRKLPVRRSHLKAASSAHIVHFAQVVDAHFYLITHFVPETTVIIQISQGWGRITIGLRGCIISSFTMLKGVC